MKIPRLIPLLPISLCAPAVLPAASILSTNFANPVSDAVPVYDGSTTTNRSVGARVNWTVANSSEVDLLQVDSFTVGTHIYGTVADPVNAGKWVTMLGDGSYTDGTNAASVRLNTGGDVNIQFNSSTIGNSSAAAPANVGIFTFAFEVKSGTTVSGLSATFDFGTGTTSGGWYVPSGSDAITDNGYFNVRIVGLDNSTNFLFYGSPQLANTAPLYTDSPYLATAVDQGSNVLAAGQYRLEIIASGKTLNQRFTIDDFTLSGTVPEPATFALLFGLAALGWVIRGRCALRA